MHKKAVFFAALLRGKNLFLESYPFQKTYQQFQFPILTAKKFHTITTPKTPFAKHYTTKGYKKDIFFVTFFHRLRFRYKTGFSGSFQHIMEIYGFFWKILRTFTK